MDDNYLSETEISPKELIKYMKSNIYNIHFKNNYQYISSDYILNRTSLFFLIRKISNKLGFKSQTYFLSIYYLDILFSKNKKIECNYKTLGLACLLLSAKYIENDPYVPNLPSFIKAYNIVVGYKNIISVTDLFYAEVLTCKMLGYKLNYYTIYDFDSFFFGHGIIKMEQIRDLNNENLAKNKNNYEINAFNSVVIRQILEKIYRKSRHYLELIINNSKICLRYSSLIISIYIMKKSIEEILYEEQRINQHDLLRRESFVNKTSKYFKEIMNEIYDINYESMDSFSELVSDTELIKLLQEEKKGELSPALAELKNNNNNKFANYSNKGTINSSSKNNNSEKNSKKHTISSYGHIKNLYNLDSLSSKYKIPGNNKSLLDSMNIYLNKNDNFYKTFISQSSSSVYQLSSKSKEKDSLTHKQSDVISNNFDISNPSSTKELNPLEFKRKKYQNQRANRAFTRHSEINCLRHLKNTYNDFSSLGTRTNESNNVSKKNFKEVSKFSKEELDEKYNDSIENKTTTVKNEEIKFESPIRFDKYEGYNYDNYKKLKDLRAKVFRDINIKNRHNSGYMMDSSNTINTVNTVNTINTIGTTYIFGDENNSKNYMKIPKNDIKPYSKKVIRNTSNSSKNPKKVFPVKKKTISCFFTSNNFCKSKLYNSLMVNPLSSNLKKDEKIQKANIEQNKNNVKEEDNNINDNKIDNGHDKLGSNDNKGQKPIFNSKNFNQKSNYFNIRKNIYVNLIEDNDEKDKKNEEKIYIKEELDINLNNENNEKDKKENVDKKKGKDNKDNKISKINGYSSIATSYYNRRERQKQLMERITKTNSQTFGKTNDDNNNNINDVNKKETNIEIKDQNINKTVEKINSENKNNDDNNNKKKYKRRVPRNESKNELNRINSYMDSKPNVFMRKKFFVSSKNKNKNESGDIKKENNNNNINNSKEGKCHENQMNKDESKTNVTINPNPNALTSKNVNSRNDNKYKSIRYRYINSKKKVFEPISKGINELEKNNNKDSEDNKEDNKDENKLDKKDIKEDKAEEDKEKVNDKVNDKVKDKVNDKDKDKDMEEEKEEILEIKHHKNKTELKEVKRNFNDRIRNYIKNDEKNNLNKKKLQIKINKREQNTVLSKTTHPTSSIFKLLSRTKNLTGNNIQLSKEELELEIPNGYNFLRNHKYNRNRKNIKTIEQSDSKENDKNKEKNNTTIEKKEIILKNDRFSNTISTDNNTNNQNKNNNKNDNRVIHTYQYRNLLKNKLTKNIIEEASNNKLNINTNNTTNTIVINNNININFNNKMEPTTGRFIPNLNKNLKRNETEAKKIGNYFEKINPNKRNNINKVDWKNYYSGGTIDCINTNKNNYNNQNNSISSLLHQLPFYRKTLENNRKILSGDLSIH